MNEMNARTQAVGWATLGGAPVFIWEMGQPQVDAPLPAMPAVELQGGPGVGELVQRLVQRVVRSSRQSTPTSAELPAHR